MKKIPAWVAPTGLLFGGVCWGVIWYPYRLMQEAGVSGVASSFYTYIITACFGLLLFARSWHWGKTPPKAVFALGLVAGWTNMSYVLAVISGEVMRVMLLFYLSPIWTLLLAHFWLKEKTNWQGVLVIIASMTGAFIMLWHPGAIPLPQNTSEWLAVSSGIGFALTNVITRKSSHLTIATKSMAVWLGVIVVASCLLPFQSLPFPFPNEFNATHWLIMTFIALLLFSATVLVQYGVTHMRATRASVLFLFELVVAAIASYYLANEVMEPHEWLGGLLIIAAAVYSAKMNDAEGKA